MIEDNTKRVQESSQLCGGPLPKEHVVVALDKLIEMLQKLRKDAEKGSPLGFHVRQFRDLQPGRNPIGVLKGFYQKGPVITEITIADYRESGKELQ